MLWHPTQSSGRTPFLQHGEGAADWTAAVQSSIRKSADRPRSLLVFLNPFGGSRQAQAVWDKVARPIMLLAGAPATLHADAEVVLYADVCRPRRLCAHIIQHATARQLPGCSDTADMCQQLRRCCGAAVTRTHPVHGGQHREGNL
jgi:hypothetical protein